MAELQNIDNDLYKKIHHFVNKRMGLYFTENRKKDLIRGLNYASESFGYKDVNTCIEQLLSVNWTTNQIQTLANYLTVGETYFYRHREQLEYIFTHYLKKKTPQTKIKIWCSGCCTGEEPYSIAIMSREFSFISNQFDIEIIATDINSTFIKKAVSGIYTEHSLRTVPKTIIKKYFTQTGSNQFVLDEKIRDKINFKYLNLASNTYPSEVNNTHCLDIILCRNVFIYFQQETIDRVVKNFNKCLNKDGILFVSPAETFMISRHILGKIVTAPVTVFSKNNGNLNNNKTPETSVLKPASRVKYNPKNTKTTEPKSTKTIYDTGKEKIKLSSNNKDYLKMLRNLYSKKRYKEILQVFKNIDINKINNDIKKEIYSIVCKSYSKSGNMEKAYDQSCRLVDIDKLDPESQFVHASILLEADRIREAEKVFEKVLYLDPCHIMSYFMLGNLHMINSNIEKAMKNFKRAHSLLQREPPGKILDDTEQLTAGKLKEIIATMLKARQMKT
ncbi:MAG: hypothetical protein K9M56_00270 [Victivallales bacterium]|nr:hypothetical protein [Victivallales bacterium]